MSYSFVFAPRMHEDISNCYSILSDKNTQESMHKIDDFSMLHTTYFNPFLEKKSDAVELNLVKCDVVETQELEKYIVLSPEFPLKKNQALQYLEDFRRESLEYDREVHDHIQSHSVNSEARSAHLLGFSEKEFDQEEAFVLSNFVMEAHEKKEAFSHKGVEQEEKSQDEIEPAQVGEQEDIEQEKILKQMQILLILAWLQEEQDMDLFVLQQKILQKDLAIKSLLKNPYEKRFLESEMSQMSHAELYEELQKDFFEKEEDIKSSFSFNVVKEKKILEKKILSYEWNREDFNLFEFSTDWRKIFFAQLHFMPQDVIFVVNDRLMRDDLLNIAMNNKDQIQFDNNISLENYEQKEFVLLKEMCSKNKLHYSFLTCPLELIFKKKNQFFLKKYGEKYGEKYEKRQIAFLLKRE